MLPCDPPQPRSRRRNLPAGPNGSRGRPRIPPSQTVTPDSSCNAPQVPPLVPRRRSPRKSGRRSPGRNRPRPLPVSLLHRRGIPSVSRVGSRMGHARRAVRQRADIVFHRIDVCGVVQVSQAYGVGKVLPYLEGTLRSFPSTSRSNESPSLRAEFLPILPPCWRLRSM